MRMNQRLWVVLLLIAVCNSIPSAWADTAEDECRAQTYNQADIEAELTKNALQYKLDPYFLWALAKVESNLDPCARSPVGAMGIMQLMPDTARFLGVQDPFNYQQNIAGGAQLIANLVKKFEVPQLYLAAYNAGPQAVKNWRRVPNYPETKEFLRRVVRAYQHKAKIDDDFKAIEKLSNQPLTQKDKPAPIFSP